MDKDWAKKKTAREVAATFGKITDQTPQVIGLFLLGLTNLDHVVEVGAYIMKQLGTCVDLGYNDTCNSGTTANTFSCNHLSFKEPEEWVFDIFSSSSQRVVRLEKGLLVL